MEINADTRRTSRSGDCSILGSVNVIHPFLHLNATAKGATPLLAKVPRSGAGRAVGVKVRTRGLCRVKRVRSPYATLTHHTSHHITAGDWDSTVEATRCCGWGGEGAVLTDC